MTDARDFEDIGKPDRVRSRIFAGYEDEATVVIFE
jgi:hypothetical protein